MSTFQILHKDRKTKARIGLIKTKKGNIETPFFMPVATKTSVKYLSSLDLEEINVPAVISNMFILHLKPGEKLIKNLGGIGKFMNFKGVNATDSGGFQMYSPSFYVSSNEKGVEFKNPYTGKRVFLTPEQDMKIQMDLNSEIAMCLDNMPLFGQSKEKINDAVKKTSLWAVRCKKTHTLLQKNKKEKQLLFGICQGGTFPDLRKKSANSLVKLNFDGYSIGGLGLGEPKEKEYEMIKIIKKIIPDSKPIYLMGVGSPLEILEGISLGVDMFDSRLPTKNARHGCLFTSKGKLRIFNKKYEKDKSPIDKDCKCKVCRNYSRAYVRFQLSMEEGVGYYLASYHNIYFITNLIKESKEAIKKGKFLEFKKKVSKYYSH